LVLGQHALVQDTGNPNAAWFLPVKYNMLALLHSTQPRTNFVTWPPNSWATGKELATLFHLAEVKAGLGFAPGAICINTDIVQIDFGAA